jgi:hypothetical protein
MPAIAPVLKPDELPLLEEGKVELVLLFVGELDPI